MILYYEHLQQIAPQLQWHIIWFETLCCPSRKRVNRNLVGLVEHKYLIRYENTSSFHCGSPNVALMLAHGYVDPTLEQCWFNVAQFVSL